MLYGDIAKFETQEDGSLIIEGIASTPDKDHQGEKISPDAIRKALPEYLRSGSIREMHTLAAGKPLAAFVDDDGKLHLKAKIVDQGTISKIKEGILKEFSVGGKKLLKVGDTITALLLKEISVVDHGCNPNTFFTICKVEETAQDPKPNHMKELLAKAFGLAETATEADVVAELAKRLTPAAQTKPEDLVKSLGIEDIQKSLKTIEADAAAAKAAAVTAERNAIVAEASREGKVIPLSNDDIAKMDVTVLKNMVAALPKSAVPTQRTPVKLPEKKDDIAKFLSEKKAENVNNWNAYFRAQGLVTA